MARRRSPRGRAAGRRSARATPARARARARDARRRSGRSTASTVCGSTSLWWASIACATASVSPLRRAIRAPTWAWGPSTSWLTALPMSCSSVAAARGLDRGAELARRSSPASFDALDQVVEDVLAVGGAGSAAARGARAAPDRSRARRPRARRARPPRRSRLDLGLGVLVGLLDGAGWIRPSAISRSSISRAISRRTPSKLERTTAVRRLVDDQVDAGERLDRPDVAALAADDPALHLLAGQLDQAGRRLARVRRRPAAPSRSRGCCARAGRRRASSPPRSRAASAPPDGGPPARRRRSASASPGWRSALRSARAPSLHALLPFSSSACCRGCARGPRAPAGAARGRQLQLQGLRVVEGALLHPRELLAARLELVRVAAGAPRALRPRWRAPARGGATAETARVTPSLPLPGRPAGSFACRSTRP